MSLTALLVKYHETMFVMILLLSKAGSLIPLISSEPRGVYVPAKVFVSILLLFYVSLTPLGKILFFIIDFDPPESYSTLSKREQGRPCMLLTSMMPQIIGVL